MSTTASPGQADFVGPARVLMLSVREIARLVAYCIEYEFEDVVQSLTGARRLDVTAGDLPVFNRRVYKYARTLSGSRRLASALTAAHPSILPDSQFDWFFPIFNEPFELLALRAIPGWRHRCSRAACYVSEVWTQNTPPYVLELLGDFDHVFLGVSHCVDEVAQRIGRPCTYLPLGVDVLRFAPEAPASHRPIDVANVGRRSSVTHDALLNAAVDPTFFYYYDTVAATGSDLKQRTFRVQDPVEHRRLYASVLKRSRYFIANKGFVNDPGLTRGTDAIAARFYEGAAAGAVMLGTAPDIDEFRAQFDWPDSVIEVPYDCSTIRDVIRNLDDDPKRLDSIRRNNVTQAALRHDWLYRLKDAFAILGIAPTDAMVARERSLHALAGAFRP